MSLAKLLVGVILVVLIWFFVSEWRKWRARMQKEAELSKVKDEDVLLDLDEDIALTRAGQERRREEIDAINNPDTE